MIPAPGLAAPTTGRSRRRSAGRGRDPVLALGVGVVVALYLVLPTLFVIPMSISEATIVRVPSARVHLASL